MARLPVSQLQGSSFEELDARPYTSGALLLQTSSVPTLTHSAWVFVPLVQHLRRAQVWQSAAELGQSSEPDAVNFQYGLAGSNPKNGRVDRLCAGVQLASNVSFSPIADMQACMTASLPLQQWLHVGFVLSSQDLRVYLNGALVAQAERRLFGPPPAQSLLGVRGGGDWSTSAKLLWSKFYWLPRAATSDEMLAQFRQLQLPSPRLRETVLRSTYIAPTDGSLPVPDFGELVLARSYTKSVLVRFSGNETESDPPVTLLSSLVSRDSLQYVGTPLFEYSHHSMQLLANGSVCCGHASSLGIGTDSTQGSHLCSGSLSSFGERTWVAVACSYSAETRRFKAYVNGVLHSEALDGCEQSPNSDRSGDKCWPGSSVRLDRVGVYELGQRALQPWLFDYALPELDLSREPAQPLDVSQRHIVPF